MLPAHVAFCILLLFMLPICEPEENVNGQAKTKAELKNKLVDYIGEKSIDFFADILHDKVYSHVAFKVIVPKRRKECFYQKVDSLTGLKFEFECLSHPTFASDAKIAAYIAKFDGPTNKKIREIRDKRNGLYESRSSEAGTYSFCLDNSNYGDKKFVQLSLEFWKMSEVPKFHLENHLQNNNSMYQIYDGLFQVTKGVSLMRSALLHTRATAKYDASMLLSNLSMVNNFSVLSLLLIVGVCFLQLHLVKRMFGDPKRMGA